MLGPSMESTNCYYSQYLSKGLLVLFLLITVGKNCQNSNYNLWFPLCMKRSHYFLPSADAGLSIL